MKQYVVIGLGRFGKSVAQTLAEQGHEVVVLDTDESNINDISDIVTHAIVGDATDKRVLAAAGVKEADVVIVCITKFETSIMTSLLCQELGAKKIIAKARNDFHAETLRKLGIDHVIIPEKDMGKKLGLNLANSKVIEAFHLSNDYEIIEIELPAIWRGQTIAHVDIRKNYGLNILGIKRGEDNFIGNPSASTDLKPGDRLIILGSTSQIKKMQEIC